MSFVAQGNKNQMVPMGMGSKSPNLQPVQSSLANSLGGPGMGQNSMVMSIASNGGQQPMSSMQGKGTRRLYSCPPLTALPFQQ